MEYALTADGAELAGALRLLADWGVAARGTGGAGAASPRACAGRPLEARWYCPTCGLVVSDREAITLDVI